MTGSIPERVAHAGNILRAVCPNEGDAAYQAIRTALLVRIAVEEYDRGPASDKWSPRN